MAAILRWSTFRAKPSRVREEFARFAPSRGASAWPPRPRRSPPIGCHWLAQGCFTRSYVRGSRRYLLFPISGDRAAAEDWEIARKGRWCCSCERKHPPGEPVAFCNAGPFDPTSYSLWMIQAGHRRRAADCQSDRCSVILPANLAAPHPAGRSKCQQAVLETRRVHVPILALLAVARRNRYAVALDSRPIRKKPSQGDNHVRLQLRAQLRRLD